MSMRGFTIESKSSSSISSCGSAGTVYVNV